MVTSFLRRFGGDGFDYARSAVAANRASGVTRAADLVVTPGPYGKRPFILCEDPQEIGRNITASAYRFKEVRALFRAANEAIAAGGDLTFLPEMAGGPRAPPRAAAAGFGGRGGFAAAKAANPAGTTPRWLAPGAGRNGNGNGARPPRKMQWTREGGAGAAGKPGKSPGRVPGRRKVPLPGRRARTRLRRSAVRERYARQRKVPGEGQGGGGRGGGGRGWSTGD